MKTIIIFYLLISNFLSTVNFKCESNHLDKSNTNTSLEIINFDNKIKGYFNDDNLEDYLIKDEKKGDKVTLSIFINNGKGYTKKATFDITNDDFESVENPLQNLFISNPKRGEILVGASCCASFKTTESCYYKFFETIDSWILYKISTATVDSDFIPTIDITYQDFSYSTDGKTRNNKSLRDKELRSLKEKNLSQLNILYKKYKDAFDNKSIGKTSGNLNFDDLAEMLTNVPLNKDNINKYNDLAYYLGLSKGGERPSIFLLKKIIDKEPSRIVAFLNLADAQWNIEQFDYAKKSYIKYNSLMKSNSKDLKKIPERVRERIK
ncbi:hypothetical protein [Flavobacterium sp.]|uniref:hypothetical protein n=1 Tax=Flavobacterium sp. TaxID=239 RepID=UPI003751807C